MTLKKYTLKVTEPQYWQEIHDLLCSASSCDHVPDREVSCVDEKEHSSTRGTFELHASEAEELQNHPHVEWVELDPTAYPEEYREPQPATKRWKKTVKVYRGLDNVIVGSTITSPTSAELDRTAWSIVRTGVSSSFDAWGTATGEDVGVITTTVDYSLSGKNVDIVIHDSGVLQYHPEFMNGNSRSRVKDVILDGPFYIDPQYFITNNLTYTKDDGRIGIATTAADAWWENGANRSSRFASIGTITIPVNYTENNTLGSSLSGTNNFISGHGTACAGLAAGKNFGLAFESDIWSIASVSASTTLTIEQTFNAIKLFHQYKPINPETGVKNPTIVNGSWGYQLSFTSGQTVNYQFRGTTGSFVGNSLTTDLVTAMKNGLNNQVSGAFASYTAPSGSNSTDTAGDEMIDAGVIYVCAAGNNNQKVGSGSNDVDRNNWLLTSVSGQCNHRDWLTPHGMGWRASDPEYHPTINVGALDDWVNSTNYGERKASYSNNGTGIDVWAPADELISAGTAGGTAPTYEDFARFDSNVYYDCRFNGTSAASPVCVGLIALYLETNPTATHRDVKSWLSDYGSKIVASDLLQDSVTDDTNFSYWLGTSNLRGSQKRIIFNPYTSSVKPTLGSSSD